MRSLKRFLFILNPQRIGWCFLIVVGLLSLFPFSASGRTLKTRITSSYKVDGPGKIDLSVEIENRGTATAYGLVLTVFFSDRVEIKDDLGDHQPGEKRQVDFIFRYNNLKPGKYVVVIRLSFEEQGGKVHHVYHFSDIVYDLMNRTRQLTGSLLDVKMASPPYNPRGLWPLRKQAIIHLTMKNRYEESLKPIVFSLYLPSGFQTARSMSTYTLSPAEIREDKIPLTIEPGVRGRHAHHAVFAYDLNGIHYESYHKGIILVEEKPFLLKYYLITGGIVLGILFIMLHLKNRKEE